MTRSEAAKLRHARMTPDEKADRAALISYKKTKYPRNHWTDDLRPPPHLRRKHARYHPFTLETDPKTGHIPVSAKELRLLRAFITSNLDDPGGSHERMVATRAYRSVTLWGFQRTCRGNRWNTDAGDPDKGVAVVEGKPTTVRLTGLVFTTPDGQIQHFAVMIPPTGVRVGGISPAEAERLEQLTYTPRVPETPADPDPTPVKPRRGRPKGAKDRKPRRRRNA